MIPVERISGLFVRFADTLVSDFDIVEFLQSLAEEAAEVSGAEAVGLMLTDTSGELRYMAASCQTAKLLELFQLQNREGPCFDCFCTSEPVVNTNLAEAADRWPRFGPRAAALGFESVHALPLRLRHQVIGALNLFGHAQVRFESGDIRLVQALADVATIGVLQERSISRAETVAEQLHRALTSRIVIEQAKGAVAQQAGVHVDEAFRALRSYARANQRRLTEVCREMVTDSQHVHELADLLAGCQGSAVSEG
ncbi:MAG TPA: GAF and ANTAR domain-containing protein [Ruania sp.]|nr:GAF and ANTAR domain-containing protein [Ruania sp.]